MTTDTTRFKTKFGTYIAKNNYVLIELKRVTTKLGNGLIEMSDSAKAQMQEGQTTGIVKAIGKYAWSDKKEPEAKVGDKVYFKRYAGTTIQNRVEGNLQDDAIYIYMEDFEVAMAIEDSE